MRLSSETRVSNFLFVTFWLEKSTLFHLLMGTNLQCFSLELRSLELFCSPRHLYYVYHPWHLGHIKKKHSDAPYAHQRHLSSFQNHFALRVLNFRQFHNVLVMSSQGPRETFFSAGWAKMSLFQTTPHHINGLLVLMGTTPNIEDTLVLKF